MYNDPSWLNLHADALHDYIDHTLKSGEDVERAIDALLLIFPYLIGEQDFRRWIKLLRDANKVAKGLNKNVYDDTFKTMYIFNRQGKRHIPPKGKRRPRVRTDGRDVFELYLNLFVTLIYSQSDWLTPQRIDDTLDFARMVNDAHLYHKFYQLLAFIHNARYEFPKALDYARLAYNHWRLKNPYDGLVILETALSLFAMAVAYDGLNEHRQAIYHLERAAELLAKTDYQSQYGIIAQETGCNYYLLGDFEAALQWFEIALREFEQLDIPYHKANAMHHVGMAQGLLGLVETAQQNLQQSLELWQSLDRPDQIAFNEHTLAYVEAKMGLKDVALNRLDASLERINKLPENAFKSYRKDMAKRLMRGIREGEDLDSLTVSG